MKHSLSLLIIPILLLATGITFAIEVGSTYYTKQPSTPLLAEANRNAASVGEVQWGKTLKVLSTNERWMYVSSGETKGWVYSGNVSSRKPPSENKNDLLPTTAADTSASVAARPLSPSSQQYANRKSLGSGAADIVWAEQQADSITKAQVDAYMTENALGDF